MSVELHEIKPHFASEELLKLLEKHDIRKGFSEHWRLVAWIEANFYFLVTVDYSPVEEGFGWAIHAEKGIKTSNAEVAWFSGIDTEEDTWTTSEEALDKGLIYFFENLLNS
ncbi:MAG TPA: hypothetical protein PKD00_00795 [Burkholderiales bacterium]|nr:hypothetical protein [Burkholderiales bacterium]